MAGWNLGGPALGVRIWGDGQRNSLDLNATRVQGLAFLEEVLEGEISVEGG